jgi:hypothetical protein
MPGYCFARSGARLRKALVFGEAAARRGWHSWNRLIDTAASVPQDALDATALGPAAGTST